MNKLVILLFDQGSNSPPELAEILQSAGIAVSAFTLSSGAFESELSAAREAEPAAVAVIYQLPRSRPGLDARGLAQKARQLWRNVPIVACANAAKPLELKTKATFRRMGFAALAESPAQLPALLRELEENPGPDEMPQPFRGTSDRTALTLPQYVRNQTLREVFDLIASLHLSSDQKESASLAIAGIDRLMPADRWSIFIAHHKSASDDIELELLASRPQETATDVTSAKDAADQDSSLFAPKPHPVAQAAASTLKPIRKTSGGDSVLALPLVSKDRIYGVLEGTRSRSTFRGFTKTELALLSAVGTPITAALSNSARIAEAERLSLTDELTRLHNARYLRQFLVNEMKRARRFGSKIAALFLDLDDFKMINDLHGHLVGSHVLMEVASVILPSVRDTDCVVRYGGDEFVVILPVTGPQEALRVADRIRAKIQGHRFTGGRRLRIGLTSSIGVAVFPDDALSPRQLVACADRAMYSAKAANKDCVRMATTPSATAETPDDEDSLPGTKQFQRIPDQTFIS
jgi:diguanylate cyclase (GGDEF)-like protein